MAGDDADVSQLRRRTGAGHAWESQRGHCPQRYEMAPSPLSACWGASLRGEVGLTWVENKRFFIFFMIFFLIKNMWADRRWYETSPTAGELFRGMIYLYREYLSQPFSGQLFGSHWPRLSGPVSWFPLKLTGSNGHSLHTLSAAKRHPSGRSLWPRGSRGGGRGLYVQFSQTGELLTFPGRSWSYCSSILTKCIEHWEVGWMKKYIMFNVKNLPTVF